MDFSLLSRGIQWAVGPGLVVLQCYLQLAPKFVVSNALLVDHKGDSEFVMRESWDEAILIVMIADMLWTALQPHGVSHRVAGMLLLLSTALGGLNTYLVYGASDSIEYSPEIAVWLQVAAGVLAIPVHQCTAIWRLGQTRSPVRWRVVGWIVSVSLGTFALLEPWTATLWPTIILSTVFPTGIAVALCLHEDHANNHNNAANKTSKKKSGSLMVNLWPTTLHYIILSIACGTHAESINDMATGLCVRAEQIKGKSGLALTNNISVLLAQVLALFSETSLSKWASSDERKRSFGFLGIWSASQLLRGFGMRLLEQGGTTGSTALAIFVFLDKYTGPLGQAALDTAAVSLLQAKAISVDSTPKSANDSTSKSKPSTFSCFLVPAAFLLSLRAGMAKFERPMWEMMLLHQDKWPIPVDWVVSIFIVVGGVASIHALSTYLPESKVELSVPEEPVGVDPTEADALDDATEATPLRDMQR